MPKAKENFPSRQCKNAEPSPKPVSSIGKDRLGKGARAPYLDREGEPHLSLRWDTKHHWPVLQREFGVTETGAAILLASYTAEGWLRYSRDHNRYTLPGQYRDPLWTYRKVIGQIDHLAMLGVLENEVSEVGNLGTQSRMRLLPDAREKIAELIGDRQLVQATPRQGIVLRDPDKRPIAYSETRAINRMRKKVEQINAFTRAAVVSGYAAAPMVRIFNQTFNRGGRWYAVGGAWQTMSKVERAGLTIDGEPVVEIDYSALHPSLLYGMAGATPPAEMYRVGNWGRNAVKLALLILINAKTKSSAIAALARKPEPEIGGCFEVAAALIDEVAEAHWPIAGYFHSDAGARLMGIDSQIAETVMMELAAQGVVCLPVHDSFIVPASKADLLRETMHRVAYDIAKVEIGTDVS